MLNFKYKYLNSIYEIIRVFLRNTTTFVYQRRIPSIYKSGEVPNMLSAGEVPSIK